jgi:transcriptional regulator with XRE-family HTH domain
MPPKLVRTPDDLKAARRALGLSADGLARMVRVEDGRTIRRWESGERDIPGPVTVLLEAAMSYLAKRELISQQLQMLQSEKMRTGRSGDGGVMADDTKETIARLSEAKASYDNALETLTILTRQPPVGETSDVVHWYHLKRLNPLYEPPQKDEWSVPCELSWEAALAYFEKHEGFTGGLEICDELAAEFILEKRLLLRTQSPSGASQWLRAGDLVDSFYVRQKVS